MGDNRFLRIAKYATFLPVLILFASCKSKPSGNTLFKLLSPDDTGIEFSNVITETDSFNILTDEYIYNGGGVAIGDFNNDGLQDIFFTGNEVPNRLYLNKGSMRFKDVTTQAAVNMEGRWNSGVVVVDINDDGWQDLYVTATMKEDSSLRNNMLFLNKGLNNDGIPVFEEAASRYGIADTGYSTTAAFFDYDLDGDLDLYVLTNQQLEDSPAAYHEKIVDGTSRNNDRLYRNNGDETFTNASKEAGIIYEGFGLGLAISDFNVDGWPDIYVSNDFISNDILYINNQDGTFANKSTGLINHQSHSSMGNDAADYDNDGLPDIITLDMLPETNSRKKTTIGNKSYLTYINNEKYKYDYQYVRNMLHRNNGVAGGIAFSEIGQLAGVHQTEWSWSPLFADFDNDGNRDLIITNGFPKDITDKDFSNYRVDVEPYVSMKNLVDSIPVVRIPNYAFKNNGDLTFKDVSKEWGLHHPSFSNGAAFADLDNDGDLDYVINNINEEAFLFENTLFNKNVKPGVHYLRVKFQGPPKNRQAIGAKILLHYDSGKLLYAEQEVARGYLSSVEDILHFGLGTNSTIDSLRVIWPDGKSEKMSNLKADQVLTLKYDASKGQPYKIKADDASPALFKEVSNALGLIFKHKEQDKIDFNLQRTLPHKFTQAGPSISVGDVNNDNRDDIILGGSSGYPLTVFTQSPAGKFSKSEIVKSDNNIREDAGILLFDADGDLDQDLYVVSGSIEHEPGSPFYQDQLFKNNGKGKFELDAQALPEIKASGSCVRAADFDGDNDLDLFVGGRVVTAGYPFPAESYLLQNDQGKFTNVTNKICPGLEKAGMITDALFTDFNSDGKSDLVVVGEFMPITFFSNKDGEFVKNSSSGLDNHVGWWNSIVGGDFDRDGDYDYVVGNLGTNNGYQVSKEFPLKVYAKDFDKNGSVDAVLACYIKESLKNSDEKKLYPIHFWDELNSQSPKFRQQFSKYKTYSETTMDKLLSPEDLQDALILQANHFESSYIENQGNGKFNLTTLPANVQFAPANGMVADDFNSDGNLDVMIVGNDYGNEVFVGRYDALKGVILLGDGTGSFRVVPPLKSGFTVAGDAKALVKLYGADGKAIFLVTQNLDSMKAYSVSASLPANPTPRVLSIAQMDSWAELIYADGKKEKIEFYYGSGYLSQSTRKMDIPAGVKEITIYAYNGESRKVQGLSSQTASK
ncbi:VCBS repeat-containing protein [Chryseolinea sp. H1M3-3]|uniref:VCBS repeat-containing protein n=1 Tax=Chryseolinea sp. H1M3-3 TaxID=3034144 RepID=UPI0023ED024F|nr:VCBS repeat-containing protein [Chryseolinea sp. H1M3-3]